MLSKVVFSFWAFCSLATGTEMVVVLKRNQEQRQRMKDVESALQIRSELMQPFSAERLQELEKAVEMTLVDIGPTTTRQGGRVIRTEKNLSSIEMKKLKQDLETVAWVDYVRLNTVPDPHHMRLPSNMFAHQLERDKPKPSLR